ncbi:MULTISPECIES: hypothetical protein [unclassified Enterococcus]|uniref:hypothetical protein n=1 Tax=unclassified Enterococcus TaxID=2608891 RepID=UPI0015518FD5|nr:MULTISPECIES: hypothetical protein [unclassified Enterococcus]MBS7576462.1 hypothetical protein [Enterococcus sp. MMGLQ5-2]MBS7583694.1 hypothetical protein [Enterococcus sp. MMGLQ5-1]NPD11555.1 hypothetical protein [Enterococcus sp. MMGLQ5-1]NPD36299.1 hypothetical protein [Enterococcus sp. MMGLQ5-2]
MLNHLALLITFTLSLAAICLAFAIFLFFKYRIIYLSKHLGYLDKFQQIIELLQRIFRVTQLFFRKKDENALSTHQAKHSAINASLAMNHSVLSPLAEIEISDDKMESINDIYNASTNQTTQLTQDYFIITQNMISLASKEKMEIIKH